MFMAVLFTIPKTWKQSKCSSKNEWIKKMRYIYIHNILLFNNIYYLITFNNNIYYNNNGHILLNNNILYIYKMG